jgi:hypothetical protein
MTEQQQHQQRNIREPKITSAIIEQALKYVGEEAKMLIMQHIRQKYGMDFTFVGEYKKEFENYLRETFYESAEIIIARIKSIVEDSTKSLATAPSSMSTVLTSKRVSKSVHFLFCDQCFWSASLLTTGFEQRCMSCGTELKCALPISSNEIFSYEIDNKRGITLSFS